MKKLHIISALSLLIPSVAAAEEPRESGSFDHPVTAAKHAIEISVATGYSQNTGVIGAGMSDLDDVSSAGGAAELAIGYRVDPAWSVGLYGTFARYGNADLSDTDVMGASAGVAGVFHARPSRSIDPWVSFGIGWKALWLDRDAGKTTALHGLELARVQLGIDYRITPEISISPVVGGSFGMFLTADSPMTTDYTEIEEKEVHFTGFAGLAGRFDIGLGR